MSKCDECKNFIKYTLNKEMDRVTCVYGILALHLITKCSHFKQKEDTKEKPKQEAKAVANKGKPPRKQPKKKVVDRVYLNT